MILISPLRNEDLLCRRNVNLPILILESNGYEEVFACSFYAICILVDCERIWVDAFFVLRRWLKFASSSFKELYLNFLIQVRFFVLYAFHSSFKFFKNIIIGIIKHKRVLDFQFSFYKTDFV